MSDFIKKAQEALERAEEDIAETRKHASSQTRVNLVELEIQLSTAWQVLYNLVAMDS